MTPAQALERLLPYARHLAYCDSRRGGISAASDCNCGLPGVLRDALEALQDAEPLVAPGRAEEDTGNFVFEQDHL